MKILQTISGLNAHSGGTATCTYDLIKGLNDIVLCDTTLLTLDVNILSDRLLGNNEDWIKALPYDAKTAFGFSMNIKHFLENETEFDLYHTNGLWMYCNHITALIARKKKKPYMMTLHGMLYPQALARSAWKKKIFKTLYFDKDIKDAACIHVTCYEEYIHYRNLEYKNPVAIIPNSIKVTSYEKTICNEEERDVFRFGYLGRIHERKRIERLIYAIKNIESLSSKIELIIIGSGDDKYETYLRNEVERLHLQNVIFTGFLSGEDKTKAIQSLTCLVVPSDFENFGMIIPEALVQRVPVIASKGTPWEILNKKKCGWWVDNDVDALTKTIEYVLQLPEEEVNKMGERGEKVVEENFLVDVVASKMETLYDWILNGGEKPDFVYLN